MAGWALSCIILVQRPQSYINEIIQVKILINMINVPQICMDGQRLRSGVSIDACFGLDFCMHRQQ